MDLLKRIGAALGRIESEPPPPTVPVTRPSPPAMARREEEIGRESQTRRTVNVEALGVVDLRELECVRTRIKGVGFYLEDDERRRFGGREYLLIPDPSNAVDPKAVAVYGKGRLVGYLSASRASMLFPAFERTGANAFRVSGTGTTANSTVLWVDVPKADALRKLRPRR